MTSIEAEPVPKRPSRTGPQAIAAVVIVFAIIGGWYWFSHRNDPASASTVASAIGAQSCDDSGFTIKSLVSGTETIYDCSVDGSNLCVTYKGGVATDSTDVVKLAFANSLGTDGPFCLNDS